MGVISGYLVVFNGHMENQICIQWCSQYTVSLWNKFTGMTLFICKVLGVYCHNRATLGTKEFTLVLSYMI